MNSDQDKCICSDVHERNGVVCRWCYIRGRRKPSDHEVRACFVCQKCGSDMLEEILAGVTVATEVFYVNAAGQAEYGEAFNEDGYIEQFQCRKCGEVVVDDLGQVPNNYDDLFEVLDKRYEYPVLGSLGI